MVDKMVYQLVDMMALMLAEKMDNKWVSRKVVNLVLLMVAKKVVLMVA